MNLSVRNNTTFSLDCTLYSRVKTGLDSYGLPTRDRQTTIASGGSAGTAPGRIWVGALLRSPDLCNGYDVYLDARNMAFASPRFAAKQGQNLDPGASKEGDDLIVASGLAVNEVRDATIHGGAHTVNLWRAPDTDDYIAFIVDIDKDDDD